MKNVLALFTAALFSLAAQAAPAPTGPAVAGSGDGLTATWVDSGSVHSLGDAIAAWSNPAFARFTETVPYINHNDGCCGMHFGGTLLQPAFDDSFVVRYIGFLNVVADGTYTFRAYTDDGFELMLGGESVMSYTTDRGPGDSVASVTLGAGLYALDFLVWEQGGAFVSELDWILPGQTDYALVPQSVLFTAAPSGPSVPEPGTLALLGAAAVVGSLRRRRA